MPTSHRSVCAPRYAPFDQRHYWTHDGRVGHDAPAALPAVAVRGKAPAKANAEPATRIRAPARSRRVRANAIPCRAGPAPGS